MIDEPLVHALAAGEAVAFVGTGASIASGMPEWRAALEDLLNHAIKLTVREPNHSDHGWRQTQEFLKNGDFLLAAEMLQRELPNPTFTGYIEKVFGRATDPSDIHRSIARLPFSLALTTNFDVLLETANGNPACCTWRDSDAVFNAIRSKKFAVVKLHGSVNDVASIRLTRTQYRDSTLANPEFNECLKALLTWKTFLFVGYSLRDSDLLHLVDEAKLRFGKKFGPHYAILPTREVDDKFRMYLRDVLSIETIGYEFDLKDPASQTREVVTILKNLAGRLQRVAILPHESVGVTSLSMRQTSPRMDPVRGPAVSSIVCAACVRGIV